MTQQTRNEVVDVFKRVDLANHCNFTTKSSKSVFIRHGAKLTSWEIHLIPVNGYMNHIQDILDAVQRVDPFISVFVTSLEGGCILLH